MAGQERKQQATKEAAMATQLRDDRDLGELVAVEQSGKPTIYSVSRTNGAVYVRGIGNRDIKVYSKKKYVSKL